jgi:hypothetical protein
MLTVRTTELIEKLIVPKLLKEFSNVYGNRKCLNVLTGVHLLLASRAV